MDNVSVPLSKEELAVLLDALAAQPLAKSYNLFNRLYRYANPQVAAPVEIPVAKLSDDDKEFGNERIN